MDYVRWIKNKVQLWDWGVIFLWTMPVVAVGFLVGLFVWIIISPSHILDSGEVIGKDFESSHWVSIGKGGYVAPEEWNLIVKNGEEEDTWEVTHMVFNETTVGDTVEYDYVCED